jgi:hypothetical protein
MMKGRTKVMVRLLATMVPMVVLTAGIAIAQAQIICTGRLCEGTQGANLIRGSRRTDVIIAKGGTDGVNGRGGSDSVQGGPSSDDPGSSPSGHNPSYRLEGGPGHDHVHGGKGDDSVTDEYGPPRASEKGWPSDTGSTRRFPAATGSPIEGSAIEIACDEHKASHGAAGYFVRWGRLGGLETPRRYGRPWFALLGRRRWGA